MDQKDRNGAIDSSARRREGLRRRPGWAVVRLAGQLSTFSLEQSKQRKRVGEQARGRARARTRQEWFGFESVTLTE